MPRQTSSNVQIIELAKRGAEVHLRELVQEIKNLVDLFPHLRDSFDTDELPIRFIMAKDSGHATKAPAEAPRRGRTPAAARKAVGARTKKDWAARRKTAKPT